MNSETGIPKFDPPFRLKQYQETVIMKCDFKLTSKVFTSLLVLAMLLSLFACGNNGDKNDGSVTTGGYNDNTSIKVDAWVTHLTNKQIANVRPQNKDKSTVYDLYMTRGETEGCQLVVYSSEKIRKAALDYDADAYKDKGITASAFIMNKTQRIEDKEWTDAAIPCDGGSFLIAKRKVVPYIVEFTTTVDTPAGDYTYTYQFTDVSTDTVYATFTVNVHVWDIVLPEDKTFATSANISTHYTQQYDIGDDMYGKYYEILLEHNICAYTLPYDILDPRADKYMSDPRVTSFIVGRSSVKNWTDEKIIQTYNKLKSNPVWFEKALFYIIDEPSNPTAVAEYAALCERFGELCPGIEVIAPFYTNKQFGAKTDQVDAMAPYTKIWCPKLCLWDEVKSYDRYLDYTPDKTFDERMLEFQAEGDRVWSYVCNSPITPYAQMFVDTDGIMHRIMMWQHYQRNIEGFLYWSTTSWGYHGVNVSPWENAFNGVKDGNGDPVYGEGFLLYPGSPVGLREPVPTNRLKILRDGIDDIELLYLAEKEFGKEWVMEKVNEVTPTLTSYTTEENFYKLRKEIGDALEKALAANK